MSVYQSGVLKPPGGTRPDLGLCGVTAVGSATMTPGQPMSSPVRGLTAKKNDSKVSFPAGDFKDAQTASFFSQ